LEHLKAAVAEKIKVPAKRLVLKYLDEDKDEVILSSDRSLRDGVDFARHAGLNSLKITAYELSKEDSSLSPVKGGSMTPTRPSGKSMTAVTSKVEASAEAAAPGASAAAALTTSSYSTALIYGGGITSLALAALGAFAYIKYRR
jgi:hypothetical protein